jgi:hypothetical protein
MLVEEIKSTNAAENRSRYNGTLGFLTTESNKKLVVLIEEVGSSYTKVVDENGIAYTLKNDTGCKLEFTQVPSKWFRITPKHIGFVCRRAERQYKRGICVDNTRLYIPDKSIGLLVKDITPEIIQQLFYPTTDIDVSFPIVPCGMFSDYFAWINTNLYIKTVPIGTVDHNTKKITLLTKIFEQELKDALNRSMSEYRL